MRCVKQSYTMAGTIGSQIGTGNVYAIGDPDVAPRDGRVPLNVGVSVVCPGPAPAGCDSRLVNVLLVPLPVSSHSQQTSPPRLTSCDPLDTSKPRFSSSFLVPFTLLPSQSPAAHPELVEGNVKNSPFYTVERLDYLKQVQSLFNNLAGSMPQQQTWTVETNWSSTETSTFSREVGLEITAGGEAKFLGSGGSWEVKVTGKLGWESSTATGYGGSTTYQTTVQIAPGTCGELLQQSTLFRAISQQGVDVAPPISGDSTTLVYLQYPPLSGI